MALNYIIAVPSFHKLYTLTTERLAHGPKDDLFGAIIGESQPHLNNLTFAQQAAEGMLNLTLSVF